MTPGHEVAIRAAVDDLVAALLAAVTEVAPVGFAPDRLLDIASASAILGIGRSRLYDEIGAGRLRSIKVGRRRLVPAGAIADFIGAGLADPLAQKRTAGPTKPTAQEERHGADAHPDR